MPFGPGRSGTPRGARSERLTARPSSWRRCSKATARVEMPEWPDGTVVTWERQHDGFYWMIASDVIRLKGDDGAVPDVPRGAPVRLPDQTKKQ